MYLAFYIDFVRPFLLLPGVRKYLLNTINKEEKLIIFKL